MTHSGKREKKRFVLKLLVLIPLLLDDPLWVLNPQGQKLESAS